MNCCTVKAILVKNRLAIVSNCFSSITAVGNRSDHCFVGGCKLVRSLC